MVLTRMGCFLLPGYMHAGDNTLLRLIDSQDNHFVISHPRKVMDLQHDHTLISDLVTVIVAAAVGK